MKIFNKINLRNKYDIFAEVIPTAIVIPTTLQFVIATWSDVEFEQLRRAAA